VWHESIRSLYIGVFKLETVSHVRIGTGENVRLPTPIDNAQARILTFDLTTGGSKQEYLIYIPASSIHGVLRSAVEEFLRTHLTSKKLGEIKKDQGDQELIKWLDRQTSPLKDIYLDSMDEFPVYGGVCYPTLEFDACQLPIREDKKRTYFQKIGRVAKTTTVKDDQKTEKEIPYLCYACQIFGATGFRGRVRILNAYPSKSFNEELVLDIISRNAIDRVTGAAAENRLFDLEAIPPGSVFYFAMIVENAYETVKYLKDTQSDQEFGKGIKDAIKSENDDVTYMDIIKIGMDMLSSGIVGIGAHNTVGFGYVEISPVIELKLSDNGLTKEFIKKYLLAPESRSNSDSNTSEILKKVLDNIKNKKSDSIAVYVNESEKIDLIKRLYPRIIRDLLASQGIIDEK